MYINVSLSWWWMLVEEAIDSTPTPPPQNSNRPHTVTLVHGLSEAVVRSQNEGPLTPSICSCHVLFVHKYSKQICYRGSESNKRTWTSLFAFASLLLDMLSLWSHGFLLVSSYVLQTQNHREWRLNCPLIQMRMWTPASLTVSEANWNPNIE